MQVGNYRGGMGIGDSKQTTDKATICRPWIPLEVAVPILRKATPGFNTIPAITDSSRKATGPIRVDWTFRDLPLADNVNTALYESNRARPQKFLTNVITALKGTQNGKDAFNCRRASGGLRGASYYKSVFGNGNPREPHAVQKGFDDSGNTVVCSVAHDDLGQDADRVADTHLGKAGAYFRPSIIAGDGYQMRAQLNFRDLPSDGTHPNWKVLRDRYTPEQLPQAH